MAYATGTVIGAQNIYDALIAFIAGTPSAACAGWTLHDSLTSKSKVVKSVGSDGKANLVFRLFHEVGEATSAKMYKSIVEPHTAMPHIFVEGYQFWNNTTHAGTNKYGRQGPRIGLWSSGDAIVYKRLNEANAPYYTDPVAAFGAGTQVLVNKHGQARSYVNATHIFKEFGTEELVTRAAPPTNITGGQGCWTYDSALDKVYYWQMSSSATMSLVFMRYDVSADSWAYMGSPVWAGGAVAASVFGLVWDGNDTIYATRGNTSTDFSFYTISTNTWVAATLAKVPPTTFGGVTNGSTFMVYVPASVSGHSEDVIFYLKGSVTTIYRYNVTSQTWTSLALGTPGATAANHGMACDGVRYLYYYGAVSPGTELYRLDLQTYISPVAANWVNLGAIAGAAKTGPSLWVDDAPTGVRVHDTHAYDYWFTGDKNHINVVTHDQTSDKYYWMSFGRFDPVHKPSVMVLASTASGSGLQTFTVDDTSAYYARDYITLIDPSTGVVKRLQIYEVTGATDFTAINDGTSFAAGTLIGSAPNPTYVADDTLRAVLGYDAGGFETDEQSACVYMEPDVTTRVAARSTPDAWGTYSFFDWVLYNGNSGLSTYGSRGFVKGAHLLVSSAAIRNADTINFDGQDYLLFKLHRTAGLMSNQIVLAVGPIN